MATKHPFYPDVLVTRDEVLDLQSQGWTVVQVDLDPAAYGQGHLPGALAWDWETQLRNPETHEILSQAEFEGLMSASGIGPETPVIVYGDNNNWFASWAFWLMRLYGHDQVRLLDGGLRAWMQGGLPVSVDTAASEPVSYSAAEADLSIKAGTENIFEAMFSPATHSILDVRSAAEYEGRLAGPGEGAGATCATTGHIPTAVNVPWDMNCHAADGTFKNPDELRELYAGYGITPDKTVITYCAIGERASLSWFVLKHLLKFPGVQNYDRSMSAWSRIPNAPIELGVAA